jgi:aldose 1-epimerase
MKKYLFCFLVLCIFNKANILSQNGISVESFGVLKNGQEAFLYTLKSQAGMQVKITNYGGYIVSWLAKDKNGVNSEIILRGTTLADYVKPNPNLGPITGRYANRIANASFSLDGITYRLFKNNGNSSLHGGKVGLNKRLWTATLINGLEPELLLEYLSPDGEEGYPGDVAFKVSYKMLQNNALEITYIATTNKATVLNLTNHTYFNLDYPENRSTVLDHTLQLNANKYLPVNEQILPLGPIEYVVETPFDFQNARKLNVSLEEQNQQTAYAANGYDHCLIFADTSSKLKKVGTLSGAISGRFMNVYTTEPAIQVYSGVSLNNSYLGYGNTFYKKYAGVCLETQHYPNAPNNSTYPSTVLRPGETYYSRTVYELGIVK